MVSTLVCQAHADSQDGPSRSVAGLKPPALPLSRRSACWPRGVDAQTGKLGLAGVPRYRGLAMIYNGAPLRVDPTLAPTVSLESPVASSSHFTGPVDFCVSRLSERRVSKSATVRVSPGCNSSRTIADRRDFPGSLASRNTIRISCADPGPPSRFAASLLRSLPDRRRVRDAQNPR